MGKQSAAKKRAANNRRNSALSSGSRTRARNLSIAAISVIVAVVISIVSISILNSKSTASGGSAGFVPAPASFVQDVTSIPLSVYNKIGVTSSVVQVTPPASVAGQPLLTFPTKSGHPAPGIFYYGAEWCPYCAAERWALVAALSRFGTWSNLGATRSSLTDSFPGTQSFTLAKASLADAPLELRAVERYSNVELPSGGYRSLMLPDAQEKALYTKYDNWSYIPGLTAGQSGAIPFLDIGNRFLVAGSSYSPAALAGLSSEQIAQGLSDPANPVTQAIVASANYLTAAVCHVTHNAPKLVCKSLGVKAARKQMHF